MTDTTRTFVIGPLFGPDDDTPRSYAEALDLVIERFTTANNEKVAVNSPLMAELGRTVGAKEGSDTSEELQAAFAMLPPRHAEVVANLVQRQKWGVREADIFAWGSLIRYEFEMIIAKARIGIENLDRDLHDRCGWQISPLALVQTLIADLRTRPGLKLTRLGQNYFDVVEPVAVTVVAVPVEAAAHDDPYDDYDRKLISMTEWERGF